MTNKQAYAEAFRIYRMKYNKRMDTREAFYRIMEIVRYNDIKARVVLNAKLAVITGAGTYPRNGAQS
jgi:hypothetical protein